MIVPSIEALYGRFDGAPRISILGAAPDLLEEIRKFPVAGVSLVLNSAFLAWPKYSVHLIANREFVSLYSSKFSKKGSCIKPNSFPAFGYAEEFLYYPSFEAAKNGNAGVRNCSLAAGHSALIPALHFSLRCRPGEIFLYGFDLSGGKHWDDGKNENKSREKFPAGARVCRQARRLFAAFPDTKICVTNPKSLLAGIHGVRTR